MISPANILKNVTTFPVALTYGNYGGPGYSGERRNEDGSLYIDPYTQQPVPYYERPKDALDELFKQHDLGDNKGTGNLLSVY